MADILSWRLAPVCTPERGAPLWPTRRFIFAPRLPLSVGFLPVFAPPTGAGEFLESIACHHQPTPPRTQRSTRPSYSSASGSSQNVLSTSLKRNRGPRGASSIPLLISLVVWASANGRLERSAREQTDFLTLGGAKSYHSVRRSSYFSSVPAGLRCTHGAGCTVRAGPQMSTTRR
jgi:hypothetical protein